jgi:hypothetical protein
LYSSARNKAGNLFSGTQSSHPINIDGKDYLSRINAANIAQGYAAGLAAGKPPTPFNDYGYPAQPQPTAGQIGDGHGISPFSAGLAGINPDAPAPPTWPPQSSGPIRYLTSRVVRASDSGVPAAVLPAPSQGPLSINDAYLEYRRRLDANQSQASAFDAGSPAAAPVPSPDSNFSSGLLGRFAAMAGVDPRNPGQFAPSPLDDQLRAFYRDDPAWFLQIRR